MGLCFSGDVGGGKAAVGGTQGSRNGGYNEAVDMMFKSRGLHALFTQIELSLSASNLRDLDITSKSDPMAVVYAKKPDGKLQELGRTEVILNNLNPCWIGKIKVAYQFEIVQPLLISVYDVDSKFHNLSIKNLNLADQDFLGEATCFLSEVVTKPNQTLTLNLTGKRTRNLGTLTLHSEETIESRTAVEVTFRCAKLANKDLFSKSDPFLRISRVVEHGGCVPICKTEVVNNNLNPVWRPLHLTTQHFASKENPLTIECFDFNRDGNHQLIGKLDTSVSELERLHREKSGSTFVFPSPKVGRLFVDHFIERQQYSFLDYISSGFELNFMVAVDFTASNGDPRNPTSLHYIDPSGQLNDYQKAIREVGDVLQFYDSDKRFPAWGFGGKVANGTKISVSHCFNLNGSLDSHDQVEGVQGIMSAYTSALHNIPLSGPTLFGQVINKATQLTSESVANNASNYFVLLIITDGVLTDIQETKDALVRASDLPLSILIVGVGSADFTQMEILDADNGCPLKSSTGRVATRDIVQFVPMQDVQRTGGQESVIQSLLEELPGQFLAYMKSRDIKPRPPMYAYHA